MTPVPPHKKPLPFEKINGYRIAEVLADGTHTWSCRGYEAGLDRNVFVKILKPHIDEYDVWKKRFQQEARICARLKHPYIVEVYGLGRIDTFDYLITEYVEGSDLKTLLDANHHLPVEAALFIMTQLLETLDYIHTRGIIHADLKPNNLLLDRFGRIKLTDFGLAWSAETVEPGFRDVLIGTPAYMSPEQISGGLVDPRSDLFACGVLLFELLSGRRPFQGETYTECINAIINDPPTDIREFEPTLPESISEFLDRILQKKPEDRWASARQALENLNQIRTTQHFPEQSDLRKYTSREKQSLSAKKQIPNYMAAALRPRRKIFWPIGLFLIILVLVTFIRVIEEPELPTGMINISEPVFYDTLSSAEDTISARQAAPLPVSQVPLPVRQIPAQVKTSADRIKTQLTDGPDSQTEEPSLTVTSDSALLQFLLEPWGKLYINEQLIDSQLIRREVRVGPGNYMITCINPLFPPFHKSMTVAAAETVAVTWSFYDQTGYLWLDIQPWGEIYIAGKWVDTSPLSFALPLSAGSHLLELKHPQFGSHRETIQITARDTLFLQINLATE